MLLVGATTAFTLSACGETYVDPDVVVTEAGATVAPTTLPTIDQNADVDSLMEMMLVQLEQLSPTIVAEDDTKPIENQLTQIWSVLQPKLDDDPVLEANLRSALDFADLAVSRKRPADADKAVKFVSDEIAARERSPEGD